MQQARLTLAWSQGIILRVPHKILPSNKDFKVLVTVTNTQLNEIWFSNRADLELHRHQDAVRHLCLQIELPVIYSASKKGSCVFWGVCCQSQQRLQ